MTRGEDASVSTENNLGKTCRGPGTLRTFYHPHFPSVSESSLLIFFPLLVLILGSRLGSQFVVHSLFPRDSQPTDRSVMTVKYMNKFNIMSKHNVHASHPEQHATLLTRHASSSFPRYPENAFFPHGQSTGLQIAEKAETLLYFPGFLGTEWIADRRGKSSREKWTRGRGKGMVLHRRLLSCKSW